MTTADASWDLAGRVVVGARGLAADQAAAVAEQLDPFPARAGAAGADLTLVRLSPVPAAGLAEVHGPAKDGRTTGVTADGHLLVRSGRGWVTVPHPEEACPQVALEPGSSPAACWADVVRPALHSCLHPGDAVAVHAAAVERAGRAVLVAGWSESGKTEVALALVEAGAGFLSDKWTVTGADGQVSAFPVGVGVRGWALPALPSLRSTLPAPARAQLRAARVLDVSTQRARRAMAGGRATALAARALTRAVELGDRAAVSPSALRAAYGDDSDPARRVPLGPVVVLVAGSTSTVTVEHVDSREVARRLARSAAYERRGWFDLQERGAYAGLPGRADARASSVAREQELLGRALARAPRLLRVTCPFPGDPRRVVDALAPHL